MRRLALFASFFLVSPAMAAPGKDSVALQSLRAAEMHWSAYQTQSANCGFSSPVLDAVERNTIQLQRKLGAAQDPGAVKVKVPIAPAAGCNSSENNAVLGAAQIMAWEALVRVDDYFQFNAMNAWSNGLSAVKAYNSIAAGTLSKQVEQALVTQNSKQAVDTRRESLRQEVVAVLMLMCPVRRPGGSRCPEIPAEIKGQDALAHIRLLAAEQLAADLARVGDMTTRGEVGTAWRLAKNAKDTRTDCRSGDKVIYPQAPDTHPAVILGNFMVRLRDWGKWSDGTIATVHHDIPGYSLLISPELGVTIDDKTPRPFIACRLD